MPTKPDTLTPQQQLAADLLAIGSSVSDAAEAVGVTRQTVSEWLNHSLPFQAALNLRQQELWRDSSERLRSLVPKALEILAGRMDSGSMVAAVHVLKAAGLYGLSAPAGSIHVAELEADESVRQREVRLRSL